MDYYLRSDNNEYEEEMDYCSLDPHEYADYFNGNWGCWTIVYFNLVLITAWAMSSVDNKFQNF